MKKVIKTMFAATLVLAAIFCVSCKKDSGNKCPLESLNGTSWTTEEGGQVMTLSFQDFNFSLENKQTAGEITVSVTVVGPYTYDNPNFEGTFRNVSVQPDIPGLTDLLKDNFPIDATLPGTVSSDGKTLTTHGDVPKTFKRK